MLFRPNRDSTLDTMAAIRSIKGREIIDSRGSPTVEVDITLDDGHIARAAVPSGASTGKKEALELRDNDASRFSGRGVRRAIQNVNEIIGPKIIGMDPSSQREIDQVMLELDGTANKSRLGANAILGVSLAVAHAGAMSAGLPLYRHLGGSEATTMPVPMMNILNGGAHADNNLDFQEFMFIPIEGSFGESLRMSAEVFHALKGILRERGLGTSVGDEGGFAPMLKSHSEALELIMDAAEGVGLAGGQDFLLALDAAASEFAADDTYLMRKSTGSELTSGEMIDMYSGLCDTYPIISIEDPLSETDWKGWVEITSRLGDRIQLVGDDVFVTNKAILEEGIQQGIANAILIKVNQIGSLTETLDTMSCASEADYCCVVSHRSGETEDTSISDISVATGAGQIKTGAPSRGERTAKYNRLLRIEEELGELARYPGKCAFRVSR